MTKQFITAKDIQQITGQSYGWSQKVSANSTTGSRLMDT